MEVSDFPFGKDPRQRSAHPPPRRHAAAVAFATRGAVASTAWGVSRLHRVGRQSYPGARHPERIQVFIPYAEILAGRVDGVEPQTDEKSEAGSHQRN